MIGAKTLKFDTEDGGDEVLVIYWVGLREEEDRIGVETEEGEGIQVSVEDAPRLARTLRRMVAWSKTEAGKKCVSRLRKKEQEFDES